PTDVLYLPTNTAATLSGEGRVAVAEAPTKEPKEWKYIAPARTPGERRGAARSSRQLHNFGTPEARGAARASVCEVTTPGETWRSDPAHKHDAYKPGHGSELEEGDSFASAPARVVGDPDAADGA